MLDDRIRVCKLAIDNAQQASNEEEKSSAGDKFETSRAMNHLEREMYSKQLQSNFEERSALQSIELDGVHEKVKTGSFVVCMKFDIFIAAGLGKTQVDDRTVYLLSPEAPLATSLKNKMQGERFLFNNQEESIVAVY